MLCYCTAFHQKGELLQTLQYFPLFKDIPSLKSSTDILLEMRMPNLGALKYDIIFQASAVELEFYNIECKAWQWAVPSLALWKKLVKMETGEAIKQSQGRNNPRTLPLH